MPTSRPLTRILDRLVGLVAARVEQRTGIPRGPEVDLQIRALVLFAVVIMLMATGWGLSHLVGGRILPGTLYLLQAPVVLATAGLLLWSGYLRVSSHLLMLLAVTSVCMATLLTGGLQLANVTPFFMLLVVPVFLLGRQGFVWAAISLVAALAFEVAARAGFQFPTYVGNAQDDALVTWLVSGVIVFAFVAFYEANRSHTWEQLQASNQALISSEEQYRQLVDNAHEAILVVQDGVIRFHNPRLRRMTSRSAGDLTGASFSALVVPEDLGALDDMLARVLGGLELPPLIGVRVVDALDQIHWVDVAVERIPWEREPALLVFLNDVTDQHEAEEELANREAELRQAQKMDAIGRLAGGVAHDFNNLLTTIMGSARLILDQTSEAWPLREDADDIHSAAERASKLTHQLLAFSRKQVLQPVILDPNAAVESLVKMLRRLIGEDIRLELYLEPGLARIRADEGQLGQVLMNLAVNARDAMPDGGSLLLSTSVVEVDHPVESSPPGRYVRLGVEDDGIGMDEVTVARVFEPFFTTRTRGTGLGLSVAYGIVKQHGGWMDVHSAPGVGTTFEVFLPAVDRTPTPVAAPQRTEGPRGQGQRILLVEDDSRVRRMALRFLVAWGYQVVPVDSAEEALALLGLDSDFALLFTDVVLPGLNGMQLVEAVLEEYSHMGVLLTSGYTDERARWEQIQERQLPFLHKPYTQESLLTAVHKALAG